MRRRVQPTEFTPDGDYPDRPGVQSPTRALDAIIRHTAQRMAVTDGAILTAIQRELACSTTNGEDATSASVDELAAAVFGFLWFVDRGHIRIDPRDQNAPAIRDLRTAAFALFPERRERYVAELTQARSRDVLEAPAHRFCSIAAGRAA